MINKNFKHRRNAFTLAEVIVAIGVLGVLAVIALPTLMTNINQVIMENTEKKQISTLSQGITLLSLRSPRMNFNTTEHFVERLQSSMKISKVCNSEHIADCWPTESIVLSSGDEYAISGATSKEVFAMGNTDPNGGSADYADDNTAFVTESGTPVLINYNKYCSASASDMNRTCYVAIMDLNGKGAPNKIGEDIRLINATTFAGSDSGSDLDETAGHTGSREWNSYRDDDSE